MYKINFDMFDSCRVKLIFVWLLSIKIDFDSKIDST